MRSKLTPPPIIASLSPHAHAAVATADIAIRPRNCRVFADIVRVRTSVGPNILLPNAAANGRPASRTECRTCLTDTFRTMPEPELPAPANASIYRIADLQLDIGQVRLTRDGREIALPKLSFDLLVALAEAAPRLLTLDDLMQRVWRGVIVSPETISQRVKLLRDALGRRRGPPRYVASVRGRGYRLIPNAEPLRHRQRRSARRRPRDRFAGTVQLRHRPNSCPGAAGVRALSGWYLAAFAVAGVSVDVDRIEERERRRRRPVCRHRRPPRAVAVLPFKDLSGSQAGSTLALGIAETLRHQLSGLKDIDVIGQSSSQALRDADLDPREVGRRLHARYLLGGSVQSAPSRLRVTAQLIDATTGLQLWSIRFDRAPEDVFAMEDEIAVAVAKALALSVDADTRGRLTRQGTTDFDAYLAFLQGRALLSSGSVQDARLAIGQFERAIAGDAEFAAAYVALAEAQVFAAEYDPASDRGTAFVRVLEQARTARGAGADDRSDARRCLPAARVPARIRRPESGRERPATRSRAEPERRARLRQARERRVRGSLARHRSARAARSGAQDRTARTRVRRHEGGV